jgi:hypothetical protein
MDQYWNNNWLEKSAMLAGKSVPVPLCQPIKKLPCPFYVSIKGLKY